MTISTDVRLALSADNPVDALVKVVIAWRHDGVSSEEARNRLTKIRSELASSEDDARDDAVLEVLDFVVGWCGSDKRIY